MVVGAPEGLVLGIDVVAHEHGAEVIADLLEVHVDDVFFLDLVEVSIDLLVDRAYFLQFSQLQAAGILPTG